jgi:DNA-binding PadR family transcriptional regulator
MRRTQNSFGSPFAGEPSGWRPGRARRHHPEPPFPPGGPFGPRGHGRGPGPDHDHDHDHDHEEHAPEHGGRHGGPGWGPGRRGGRGGRRGERGRAARGDVRTAMLLLLDEQPMHGYQLMQAMAERTGGVWRPSPGAVYPTIAQLEDEGLVTTQVDGGRKLVTLTDAGRDHVQEQRSSWEDPFAALSGEGDGVDLRGPLREVHLAAMHIAARGSRAQVEAAARALSEVRRSLYLILADDPDITTGTTTTGMTTTGMTTTDTSPTT